MSDVKDQVRALLDRLPDDCTYADVQRGIAVLMWPKRENGVGVWHVVGRHPAGKTVYGKIFPVNGPVH